ncbi:MAG: hypothetical protein M0Z29_08735 [Actinomycetota bacterium]|nr:hypothetical protein [Actinomycetota bacterium]
MNPIKALVAAIPTLALGGAVFLGAGAAAAAPGPTPNNETGAANMVNAHAKPAMVNAMKINNPKGSSGMWCAVYFTNGMESPGPCNKPTQ